MKKFLFTLIFFTAYSLALKAEPKTIAILPFKNNATSEDAWLSTGLSDALISKFAEEKSVILVEREKILEVMSRESDLEDEEKRKLLSASHLVIGSYVIAQQQIKVFVRIVSSENAKVEKNMVFQYREPLDKIFILQNQMAKAVSKFCSIELSQRILNHRPAKNLNSYKSYHQGRVAFEKGDYGNAITYFITAQTSNGGFFPEAHHWEGKARLAQSQNTKDQKLQTKRKKTFIEKFRKDAAEAAPAFYDLGLAHQKLGQFDEAIGAYQNFIRWYDEAAKPYRWSQKNLSGYVIITEDAPNYYTHGKRRRDQETQWKNEEYRPWVVYGDHIFTFDRGLSLFCHSLSSGKRMWKSDFIKSENWKGQKRETIAITVRQKNIYVSNRQKLWIIDKAKGEVLREIEQNQSRCRDRRLIVLEEDNIVIQLLCLAWVAQRISDGHVLWSKKMTNHIHDYATCLVGDHLYYSKYKQHDLFSLDVKTGKTKELRRAEKPIAQLWPAEDHLLLRTTHSPVTAKHDTFHTYELSTNKLSPPRKDLFFSYIYNELIDGYQELKIPLIDQDDGFYKLIPAKLILPYSLTHTMDRYTDLYQSSDTLPWVILKKNHLWVWTMQQLVRQLDATTGELLWKKSIPGSLSGIDVSNSYIVTLASRSLNVYLSDTSSSSFRSVNAYVNLGLCQRAKHDYVNAIKSLNIALKNDATNIQANAVMAELQAEMANLNESLEFHDKALRFATKNTRVGQESLEVLKKVTGLNNTFQLEGCKSMALFEQHLIFEHTRQSRKSIGRYEIATQEMNPDFIQSPGQWQPYKNGIIHFNPGKLYPVATYEHVRNRKSKVSDEDIKRIEKLPDPGSHLYYTDIESGKSRKITSFTGFDNRFYKPSLQERGNEKFYLVRDGIFIYGNQKRHLVAISLESGKQLWSYPIKGNVSINADGRDLIISTVDLDNKATLYPIECIDLHKGNLKWKSEINLNMRPGLIWGKWKASPPIPGGLHALICFQGDRVYVTYRIRNQFSYYSHPRHPMFLIDRKTGQQVGKTEFFKNIVWGWQHRGVPILRSENWTYRFKKSPRTEFVIDENTLALGNNDNKQHVSPADLWESHPDLLKEFEFLSHLQTDADEATICQEINRLIDDPEQRKKIISRYKNGFLSLRFGYESPSSLIKYLLKQKNHSELEERMITRHLFSAWKDYDPLVSIRYHAYPTPLRFSVSTPVVDKHENSWMVGAYKKGMLMIADRRNKYKNLTKWNRIARIGDAKFTHSSFGNIYQNQSHLAILTDYGKVYLFDWYRLSHYLRHTVISDKHHHFIVCTQQTSTQSPPPSTAEIGFLHDNDIKTAPQSNSPKILAAGIDFGKKVKLNHVKFSALPGKESQLIGSIIQGSNYSETSRFQPLTRVEQVVKGMNSLNFKNTQAYRYYRFVPPKDKNFSLSELKF